MTGLGKGTSDKLFDALCFIKTTTFRRYVVIFQSVPALYLFFAYCPAMLCQGKTFLTAFA